MLTIYPFNIYLTTGLVHKWWTPHMQWTLTEEEWNEEHMGRANTAAVRDDVCWWHHSTSLYSPSECTSSMCIILFPYLKAKHVKCLNVLLFILDDVWFRIGVNTPETAYVGHSFLFNVKMSTIGIKRVFMSQSVKSVFCFFSVFFPYCM